MSDDVRVLCSSAASSNDDTTSNRSEEGSPLDQKPPAAAPWPLAGHQLMNLSPTAADQAALLGMSAEPAQGSSTASSSDLSGDAEGVWSPDIDQAFQVHLPDYLEPCFQEALSIYPPCGRRKIILSDEGKMYGRNELIARYIKIRCGKTRTRKQVSSHIQVLARKRLRESQGKIPKSEPTAANSELPSPQKDTSLQSLTQLAGLSKGPTANGAALLQAANGVLPGGIYPALWGQGFASAVPAALHPHDLKAFQPRIVVNGGGYENLPFITTPPLKTLVPSPQPPLLSRCIASSLLTLKGFTAYVDFKDKGRVTLVRIPEVNDEPLEPLHLDAVAEKYPPQLRELLAAGPLDAFFVVKCWANVAFDVDEGSQSLYAVDSFYTSRQRFDVSVSTQVCSFGKHVVEKVETYAPSPQSEDGLYSFRMEGSPMCEYMVKFIAELKKLDSHETMNNVLENFTVLQVVTNKETRETLMVIAFVFAVSKDDESACNVYRLTL